MGRSSMMLLLQVEQVNVLQPTVQFWWLAVDDVVDGEVEANVQGLPGRYLERLPFRQ